MVVCDSHSKRPREESARFYELSNHEVVRLEKNSSEFFELLNLEEMRHEKNRKVLRIVEPRSGETGEELIRVLRWSVHTFNS